MAGPSGASASRRRLAGRACTSGRLKRQPESRRLLRRSTMYSEIARAQRSVVSLVVGQRLPDDARRWVRGRSGLGPPWVRVKSAGIMGWVQRSALPRAHTPARARTRDEQPALPHPLCVRDFTRTTRTQCRLARNDGKKWVQVYPDPMPIQSDPGRTRPSSGRSGAGVRLSVGRSWPLTLWQFFSRSRVSVWPRVPPADSLHAGMSRRECSLAAAVSVWVHGFGTDVVNAVGDHA